MIKAETHVIGDLMVTTETRDVLHRNWEGARVAYIVRVTVTKFDGTLVRREVQNHWYDNGHLVAIVDSPLTSW